MGLKVALGAVFAYFAYNHLVVPVMMKRMVKIPARIKIDKIAKSEFCISKNEQFNRGFADLRSLGFRYFKSAAINIDISPMYSSVFHHPNNGSFASLSVNGSVESDPAYVSFFQLYSDGSLLDVSNNPLTNVLPPMDFRPSLRCSDVTELTDLYEIFVHARALLGCSKMPIAYPESDGFRPLEESIKRESDELVRLGYCHAALDDDGNRALTLKGACLMAWKMAIPGKYIINHLEKRRLAAMLQNTG